MCENDSKIELNRSVEMVELDKPRNEWVDKLITLFVG